MLKHFLSSQDQGKDAYYHCFYSKVYQLFWAMQEDKEMK